MQIEMRRTDSVRPYDNNPRLNDQAVDAVANSIREYGWRQPIVVDAEGVIVVGHTRWKAAKKMGLADVPVHVAHDLDPVKARAYRLADNATAQNAEWDMELLPLELAALDELDFDLSLLGFPDSELAELMAPPANAGLVDPDDVPEPAKTAITQRGDTWHLGEHLLRCGDSTDPADVDSLMDGAKAALCATDPPYLIDYTGDRPENSGKDWTATYREIDVKDPEAFFKAAFGQVLRVLAPKAPVYCWHAHKRQALMSKVWDELGILNHQQVVWVKPTAVFGRSVWHFRHEPCMLGWAKGSAPDHDGDHAFNSVWEVDWEGKQRIVGNEHPTQKPVELFARPMRKHTRPGDIVYEPFSGSGSQIIAAEQQGRRCYAMELEPVFVEVAVRRWAAFTAGTPRRYDGQGNEQPGLGPAAPAPPRTTRRTRTTTDEKTPGVPGVGGAA